MRRGSEGDILGTAFQFFAFESRPLMYLLSMFCYAIPILYVSKPHSFFDSTAAALLWGFIFMVLFEAPSNVWNAINDVVEDRENKPYQFIASGDFPAPLAEKLVLATWGTLLVIAAAMTMETGRPILPFTLVAILMSFLYSDGKYTKARLKGRHIFSSLAALVGFSALFTATAYFVSSNVLADPLLVDILAFLGFQYASLMVLKDYFDVKGDALAGLRTLPVVSTRLADAVTVTWSLLAIAFAVDAYFRGGGWRALVFGAGAMIFGLLLFAAYKKSGRKEHVYLALVVEKILAPIAWAVSLLF